MDKIKICSTDRHTVIEMPRVKDITVGAEEVANAVTMASGKVVKDMIGYRSTLKMQQRIRLLASNAES